MVQVGPTITQGVRDDKYDAKDDEHNVEDNECSAENNKHSATGDPSKCTGREIEMPPTHTTIDIEYQELDNALFMQSNASMLHMYHTTTTVLSNQM